jgi:hypothetical protein
MLFCAHPWYDHLSSTRMNECGTAYAHTATCSSRFYSCHSACTAYPTSPRRTRIYVEPLFSAPDQLVYDRDGAAVLFHRGVDISAREHHVVGHGGQSPAARIRNPSLVRTSRSSARPLVASSVRLNRGGDRTPQRVHALSASVACAAELYRHGSISVSRSTRDAPSQDRSTPRCGPSTDTTTTAPDGAWWIIQPSTHWMGSYPSATSIARAKTAEESCAMTHSIRRRLTWRLSRPAESAQFWLPGAISRLFGLSITFSWLA